MILEVSLSNIFSIRDQVTLDMQAGNIQTASARALADNVFSCGDETLLKSVGIIGANASGKSNVIKAIRVFLDIIKNSHNYNENTVFGVVPFKFYGYADRSSSFYIRFLMEGTEYEYSFSVLKNEILTESLFSYPNGRRSLVYQRDENSAVEKKDAYTFQKSILRPMDVVRNTSRKTLFLSRASQMDREIPKKIFRFFAEQIIVDFPNGVAVNQNLVQGMYKSRLLQVLQEADSDIVDVKVQNGSVFTFHRNNPAIPFDFETEESDGTKALFRLMLGIMDALDNGRLLVVDEIESSLHTKLVEFIIDMFHKSRSSQLLYTTHNTHLLNMHRVRRDQICFVNKNTDGSSDLYSLYDFKDFRDTMDLEKAYLQGRFDAVPYIFNQKD